MTEQDFFRHLLATLAYRGGICFRDAPEAFARFDTGNGTTPLTILAHLGDLLEWTLSMVQGRERPQKSVPQSWDGEVARFYMALERLDQALASGEPLQAQWTRLLQGPLADALTHVGQLAILRRMAGAPTARESFYAAEITAGRVGPDQAAPRKPF
jgi:hypothetical protein